MPISNYAGNNLLDAMLRGVAFPDPTNVYCSLHTGDPGRDGSQNEVSTAAWPAYKRMDMADGGAIASGFDAAGSRSTKNAKQILFPVNDAAADVLVSYWALWDATTGGNCLAYGQLQTSRNVQPGDIFVADTHKMTATVS